jgi:uncharacterized protein (DUF1778 family)
MCLCSGEQPIVETGGEAGRSWEVDQAKILGAPPQCFLDPSGCKPYIRGATWAMAMADRTTMRKRPPKARDERLEARISHDQKAMFQRAAELQGRTLTDFVIASVHEAAARAIEEHETLVLSDRDRAIFFDALVNPPQPSERLQRAFAEHKSRVVR